MVKKLIMLTLLAAISVNANAVSKLALDEMFVRCTVWSTLAGYKAKTKLFNTALTTSPITLEARAFNLGYAQGLVFGQEPKLRTLHARGYYSHLCAKLEPLAGAVIKETGK